MAGQSMPAFIQICPVADKYDLLITDGLIECANRPISTTPGFAGTRALSVFVAAQSNKANLDVVRESRTGRYRRLFNGVAGIWRDTLSG